jgi:hypothetical protein
LVMAMKRRVLSDRKVEMCFEKKNNYFYNIWNRMPWEDFGSDDLLDPFIEWAVHYGECCHRVGMKTCFTDQGQTDPMMSEIWNLMTLDGSGIRVIGECYRIASWNVFWKKK